MPRTLLLLAACALVTLALAAPASADYSYVSTFGATSPSSFDGPVGLDFASPTAGAQTDAGASAVDSAGNVYVADANNAKIKKFASDGTFISQFGVFGPGAGHLYCPRDVAVAPDGSIYVTDPCNRGSGAGVQKFAADGTFVATIGTWGSGDGQINCPQGISTDADGNLYVVDGPMSCGPTWGGGSVSK